MQIKNKKAKLFFSLFFSFAIFSSNIFLFSCNKNNKDKEINYGQTINCLNPKKEKYIQINTLKNIIKNKIAQEPLKEINSDAFKNKIKPIGLNVDDNPKKNKNIKELYFEILMSLLVDNNEKNGFILKWNLNNDQWKNVEITNSNSTSFYDHVEYIEKNKSIFLKLSNNKGKSKLIKSHRFKYVKIGE